MATTTVSSSSELAAAIPKGGTIEIEPGNYTLKRISFSKSGTTLTSTDEKIQPKIMMAANHPTGTAMLTGRGVSDITFDNICIDGNFSNQSGASRGSTDLRLVRFYNSSDLTFKNCTWQNAALDAIRLDSCHGITVTGNTVRDLGHEFIYAIYGCSNGKFYNNNVKTRTNSAFRLSSGASGIGIYDNVVWSVIDNTSTGPGMELDKGTFKDIEIYNNTIKNLNGSGIWFSADVAGCSNVQIHDNVFDNVGNFLNGSGKYNGYSNAGIAGAGMSGMIIENNTFQNINIGYAILMAEAKHALSSSYKWIFRNNTLKNCKYGFRVSNSRGSISGGGNAFTNVKTMKYGVTANINVTATEDTPIEPEPVENTKPTTEQIKADVTITDASGKTGSQSLVLTTSAQSPRSNGLSLVTLKLSTDGLYGTKNIEFKSNVETILSNTCTGTDWLAKVVLTRSGGKVSTIQFIIPTIKGTGSNSIKLRTSDGMYGEGVLNIILKEPEIVEEPVTNDDDTTTVVKKMLSTVILKTAKGEILHASHTDDAIGAQVINNGTSAVLTCKVKTDSGMYGEMTGTVVLKKL